MARRVVIVGGSSGVGLATARALAERGDEVWVAARHEERLRAAAHSIGPAARPLRLDARDPARLGEAFAEIGQFDHLVLAISGGRGGGPFASLSLDDLRDGFEGKFFPQVSALQAALAYLSERGSVTMVTALSARWSNPNTSGLAAVNGALEAMVRPLARELAPVRVNAVSPGVIDTPWWDRQPPERREAIFADAARRAPAGRVGRPEDVARAIIFLLDSDYVTGVIFEVDGGLHLA